ncbi:MAG: ribonuclease H-like domain-containing protein [Lachnospiraceae bacterium]|nr:ribonuclease H-like domain-containing protein [Lachnospiraceae bacterium]
MKTIDYRHTENNITVLNNYIDTYYKIMYEGSPLGGNTLSDSNTLSNTGNNPDTNHCLYFDIETTGLSARSSTLYLIGALWFDDNTINIRQWFNDDGYCEEALIEAFNEFCSGFTHLVHFNGTTFDVPYIKEKAGKYSLPIDNIEKLIQLDIYKDIRSYKNILGIENVKQVTIEKYLGINRQDTYNGGELINVYQRYVARPDAEKEHLLLLHNHDDLMGMPGISNILRYKVLLEHPEITIVSISHDENASKLVLELELKEHLALPKRLLYTNRKGVYINASDTSATLIIPIINATFKHFFKDYKNYYYLPNEDMAIHKSVAAYVSPDNRQRATKSNCYITKSDSFIICPDNDYHECFKDTANDKACYRTMDSLLNDSAVNKNVYATELLKTFL